MSDYVMGVDIGGTKSHLAIFDKSGNKIGFNSCGGLNHEDMPGSFEQLERELREFVYSSIEPHGIKPEHLDYAVFGIAGTDTKEQHAIISDIIGRLGINKYKLCNDAFLGIPAACPSGVGICAINGTGCTIAGINAKGEMLQIGGIGPLSGDLGGGFNMGAAAVAAVYASMFRRGRQTILKDMLFKSLGISDKYEFTEAIAKQFASGVSKISSYNSLLFKAGGRGDAVALELLDTVAKNYAGGLTCMFDELDFPVEDETFIVFAGSVFIKGEHPVFLDMIKRKLAKDNPNRYLSYILLEEPPVSGAIAWALREVGSKPADLRRAFEQR